MGNECIPLHNTNLSSKLDQVIESEFDKLEHDQSEDELKFSNSVKVSDEDGFEEDDSQDLDYELSNDKEDEDEILEMLLQSQNLSFEEPKQVGDSVLKLGQCNNTKVFSNYDNGDDEADDAIIVHGKTAFRRFKWIVRQVFGT